MSDETNTQNTTPAAPAAPTKAPEVAAWAWSKVVAFFGPVASLVTARTLWTIPALLVLGWITRTRDPKTGEWVWTDLHAFGLSVLWVIAGISAAYVARKFLMPEVKASEYYDLAKGGNTAAAIVVLAVAVTQAACILVVALGALRAGV